MQVGYSAPVAVTTEGWSSHGGDKFNFILNPTVFGFLILR